MPMTKDETPQFELMLFMGGVDGDILPPAVYSHILALYDALPKYVWRQPRTADGKALAPIERSFEMEGEIYDLVIKPAYVQDSRGKWKQVFPSQREELVEDALRKLAIEGRAVFIENEAGVRFTLYELQQELAAKGHTFNIAQIKEALRVCSNAQLVISPRTSPAAKSAPHRHNKGLEDGVEANLFTTLALSTREDWEKLGKKARAYVVFHPLVTRAIKAGGYRLVNYDTAMTYSRALARWIHKRLAMRYRQAHGTKPYEILHSTLARDAGLEYERLRKGIEAVTAALTEMKERGVLKEFDVQKRCEGRRKNEITDAKYYLVPSDGFVAEVRKANWHENQVIERLQRNGSLPARPPAPRQIRPSSPQPAPGPQGNLNLPFRRLPGTGR